MKRTTKIYEARDFRVMECTRFERLLVRSDDGRFNWRATCPYCGETQDLPSPSSEAAMSAHCVRCGARLDPQGWAVRAHPRGWKPAN